MLDYTKLDKTGIGQLPNVSMVLLKHNKIIIHTVHAAVETIESVYFDKQRHFGADQS